MRRLLKKLLPYSASNKIRSVVVVNRMIKAQFRSMLGLPLKTKHNKIHFGIHLAEHCNLNCAGCNHFSSIADPELVDVEEFKRDIERMAVLFNHEADSIGLLGGEPLLHPDVITLMNIVRKNFPKTRCNILTNGILLAKKDNDFWKACHDNNFLVTITHYPIKIDIETIKAKAQEHNVELKIESVALNSFFIEPVDIAGTGNFKRNFGACVRSNVCIALSHGKLYTCTFAPNIHHFNNRFGTNIPVTEEDYIDIYKAQSGEQILQQLTEPIPLCKYCNLFLRDVKWSISKKNINEWL